MSHTHRNRTFFASALLLTLLVQPTLMTVADEAAQSGAVKHYVVRPNQLQAGKTKTVYVSTEPASDMSEIDVVREAPNSGVAVINKTLSPDKLRLILEVQVEEDADTGPTHLTLMKGDRPVGLVELELIPFRPNPIPQQATPPGIPEEERVDYMISPLPYKVIKDNYGRRVADSFYAVEVAIGNNTGFDMQIVNLGFELSSGAQVATSDHRLVRGSVEKEQLYGTRALTMNLLNGGGLFVSGFLPFFHAVGPRANFSTFSSLLNGQFKDAFSLAAPDLTVRQLNRLENSVMHDEMIVPNNQQARTIVFVPRAAINVPKEQRDNLALVQQLLGNLIIVGRPIKFFKNRQIVVRAGASGGFNTPQPRAPNPPPGANKAAAPAITDFSPRSGFTSEQKQVTLTGSNFENSTVTVGGTPATVQSLSASSITILVPTHQAGEADVVVTNSDGQKITAPFKFSYITEMLVSGIDRPTGTVAGGEKVRIFGNGFMSGAKVTWGGTELPASAVKVSPDGMSIEVTTPAHATAESVSVTITNPSPNNQSKPLTGGFTYVQPQ